MTLQGHCTLSALLVKALFWSQGSFSRLPSHFGALCTSGLSSSSCIVCLQSPSRDSPLYHIGAQGMFVTQAEGCCELSEDDPWNSVSGRMKDRRWRGREKGQKTTAGGIWRVVQECKTKLLENRGANSRQNSRTWLGGLHGQFQIGWALHVFRCHLAKCGARGGCCGHLYIVLLDKRTSELGVRPSFS